MKGKLIEIKGNWIVFCGQFWGNYIELFPNTDTSNLFSGQDVDFEVVNEFTHPELYEDMPLFEGNKYAKLINQI